MSKPLDPAHVAWSANHFRTLRDGGLWAVPRSGLIFVKRVNPDRLELGARMPHDPAMPITAAQVREQQDAEFESIKRHFTAAGIAVVDATERE